MTTNNKTTFFLELKQQLYSSVYTSQGTMEQLLVSQSVQLLNSEEEVTSLKKVFLLQITAIDLT